MPRGKLQYNLSSGFSLLKFGQLIQIVPVLDRERHVLCPYNGSNIGALGVCSTLGESHMFQFQWHVIFLDCVTQGYSLDSKIVKHKSLKNFRGG